MNFIPFALASVLLNDGLARLDLSKSRCPSVEIFISGIRHEATNVDVGNSLWILKALGEAQVLLVCPQGWHGTRDGRISHDELIQVDHFIAFVVLGLHWLDRSSNVCLVVN